MHDVINYTREVQTKYVISQQCIPRLIYNGKRTILLVTYISQKFIIYINFYIKLHIINSI